MSQPTVTDSLAALERKGFIARGSDPEDGRALGVHTTAAGGAALKAAQGQMPRLETALSALSRKEQAALLHIMIKMIRSLLHDQAMPVQRMCVNCNYFRPNVHEGEAPHHCAFVNSPMKSAHLRLDCAEHAAAPPEAQADAWRRFVNAG